MCTHARRCSSRRLVIGLQAVPRVNLGEDQARALTERIQDAGTEVVKAKASKDHPSLQATNYQAPHYVLKAQVSSESACF